MRIRSLVALAVLPIVFGLSACGGGRSDNGVATANSGGAAAAASPSQSIDARDAQLKYAQCMREHGIDVPDPKPGEGLKIQGPEGGDKTKTEAAQKACRHLLPGGGPGGDK
jgi:hypothetical protein